MRPLSCLSFGLALICAFIGSGLGFLVGKAWVSVPDLRDEVARLQAELNQAKLARTKSYRRFHIPRALIQPVSPESTEAELSEEQQREKIKREVIRRGIEAALARKAAEDAELYEPVLQELGLTPEAITQVRSNLVELHKKADTAGEPMGQLAIARAEYDNQMRSLLGEDAYERYRLFEASKPALREYEMLRQYAIEKRGWSLDSAQAHVFIDLMRDAGATTTVTWDGPYDPLPRPIAGSFLIEALEPEYNVLVDKANSLLDSAVTSGISEEYIELLEEYYTDKAQEAYDKMVYWHMSPEERRAADDARAQADFERIVGK